MEEGPQYRLRQYNPGAWCIEQLRVVPEINVKTGKKNKNPGERWDAIKYPGNLRQACERLLSLVTGLEVERDVVELKDAVILAERRLTANVEEYVMVRESE